MGWKQYVITAVSPLGIYPLALMERAPLVKYQGRKFFQNLADSLTEWRLLNRDSS
jgi:hypothetical protein